MKNRKCTICGKEFLSINGKKCCSENCFEKKERRFRIAMGIIDDIASYLTLFTKKFVLYVGKTFKTLRNKYCSKECSYVARKTNKRKFSNIL